MQILLNVTLMCVLKTAPHQEIVVHLLTGLTIWDFWQLLQDYLQTHWLQCDNHSKAFCFFFSFAWQPSERLLELPFILAIILQPLLSGRPWPSLTQHHLMCHPCQLIYINEWRSLLWRTAEWHAKWQVASGRVNLLKDAADQTAIHTYWLKRQEDVLHRRSSVLAQADHELAVFSALTCRSDCIWMALLQCASWSVWWAHHFLQSATRSLPMNTCKVSHLEIQNQRLKK